MAVQFHVSYSEYCTGIGVIAGGPYWCAQYDVLLATTACVKSIDLINVSELILATETAYVLDSICNPIYLANSRVYIYAGMSDSVVNPGAGHKAEEYYCNWVPTDNIEAEYNINSEHCMPTNFFGNNCTYLGTPFINNCNYDTAGTILSWILPRTLNPPGTPNPNNIFTIKQCDYIPLDLDPQSVGLQDYAYAYIPSACQSDPYNCDMHVAFHGCEQTVDCINDTYYTQTGYNQWAETNNIIILYPQAQENTLNPFGCWDWWGYTGSDYATQFGIQIATVWNMVHGVWGNSSDINSYVHNRNKINTHG